MLLFTIGSLPTSNKRLATELDQKAPTQEKQTIIFLGHSFSAFSHREQGTLL